MVACASLQAQERVVYRYQRLMESTRVSAKTNFLMLVDRDDNIKLLTCPTLQSAPEQCRLAPPVLLGQAVHASGRLRLDKLMRANEVAFEARRVTVADEVTVHVVLAWGPPNEELQRREVLYGAFPKALFLYVFRETSGRAVLEIREDLESELVSFRFDDLNGDGLQEIFVASHFYRAFGARLWQIAADGRVHPLKFVYEGYDPTLMAPDRTGSRQIHTHSIDNLGDKLVTTDYLYRWDQQKHAYVLDHKATSETTYPEPDKKDAGK
jgi:hypothetical protein